MLGILVGLAVGVAVFVLKLAGALIVAVIKLVLKAALKVVMGFGRLLAKTYKSIRARKNKDHEEQVLMKYFQSA